MCTALRKSLTVERDESRLRGAGLAGILNLPGSTPMRQQWTLLSNGNRRGLEQAVKLCRGLFYDDVTHGATQAAGSRRGFTPSSRNHVLAWMLAPFAPASTDLMPVMKLIAKETE